MAPPPPPPPPTRCQQKKKKPLALNLALINGPMDEVEGNTAALGYDNNGNDDNDNDTTYRHDGLSIGRDFVRLEGNTLSRGEFGTSLLMGNNNNNNNDNNDDQQLLGRGACSRVLKARFQLYQQDTPVALKQFPLSTDERRDMLSKELQALHAMDCESLVKLLGAFFEANTVTLVLEYMDGGSLDDLLLSGRLSDSLSAAIAFQTLWGLSYLHFESFLHRDIKPANILWHASSGAVKLADFGISTRRSNHAMQTTVVGTTLYMALERLRARPYGTPSDVWSLGLVICQCLSGTFLFHDSRRSVVELVVTLEDDAIELPETCSGARQLLDGCLQVEPSKRMPASVLLKSPWFESVGIQNVEDAKNVVLRENQLAGN